MSDNKARQLEIRARDGETDEQAIARSALRAEADAAFTRQAFLPEGSAGLTAHVDALENQIKAVHAGSMGGPEGMLVAQAATLDAIFHRLARQASAHITNGQPTAADIYLRQALRAQNQCRATLQTLGEIKNPRAVAFVKQANIANGPQQVNNGVEPSTRVRAHEENSDRANELLADQRAAQDAATLDTRAEGRASRRNKALAAVDAIDRPEDA
ncbi:hypothetical protein BurMR1_3702 [Burkholderia sp. MR1]|nr:hypothetical protein BurMR1_3702 [Burkholderia sp. MR1]